MLRERRSMPEVAVRDITAHLGSEDFARLRIGIGERGPVDAADFVLSRFRSAERPHALGGSVALGRHRHLPSAYRSRLRITRTTLSGTR